MTRRKADPAKAQKGAEFLDALAALMGAHPDIHFYYTTDDDGVYVNVDGVDAYINLGFGKGQASSARSHADGLRLLAARTI